MNRSNDYYQIYFKLAYTCQTKIYDINPNISVKNFIEEIKNKARNDFHLENDEDIEIVEAGQYIRNGQPSEEAPALVNSNIPMINLYGYRLKNTAFYIRIIPRQTTINIPQDYVEMNAFNSTHGDNILNDNNDYV